LNVPYSYRAVHPAWPQLQMMSAVWASPSQYVLQYLLPGLAGHRQLGCSHVAVLVVSGMLVSWLLDRSMKVSVSVWRTEKRQMCVDTGIFCGFPK
jgi:hypothetical protein